jgi:hypothetical protein
MKMKNELVMKNGSYNCIYMFYLLIKYQINQKSTPSINNFGHMVFERVGKRFPGIYLIL